MSLCVAKKVGGASSSLVREQDAPATIEPTPKSTMKPKLRFPEFRDAQGWKEKKPSKTLAIR